MMLTATTTGKEYRKDNKIKNFTITNRYAIFLMEVLLW